jgi:hypothetical protein
LSEKLATKASRVSDEPSAKPFVNTERGTPRKPRVVTEEFPALGTPPHPAQKASTTQAWKNLCIVDKKTQAPIG